jgi:transcriptional regulator with XRE-family HTH domain
MLFKNRVRELRKKKGMTLLELAGKAEISGAYLSDIERGNRHGSPATIDKIAAALGVSKEELFKKAG